MLARLKAYPIKGRHIQLAAESALHTSVRPRLTSPLQRLSRSPQISLSQLHLNMHSCGHKGFASTHREFYLFSSAKESLTCQDMARERGMRSLIRA